MLAPRTSLLEGISSSMENADLLNYELALETVRSGLSEEDLRSAAHEVRSLTFAQAVDIAGIDIQLLRENGRAAR